MLHPRAVLVIRIVFGLFLLLLGLIHFGQDSTGPSETQAALDFEQAILDAGYLLPFMAIVEFVAALSLLSNRYAALGLVLAFPITLNFVLFKAFLDVSTLAVAVAMLLLHVYLFFAYKPAYAGMFSSRLVQKS